VIRPRIPTLGLLALGLCASLAVHASAAEPGLEAIAGREFDCLMEPHATIKLGAAVAGLISKVDVDRGDIVHEGQVVAEMESGVQAAIVALARIRAANNFETLAHTRQTELLRRKVDRIRLLRKTDAASAVALDEAQTEADVSAITAQESELNQQIAAQELKKEEATLDRLSIRSPVNGIVTERNLSSGEYRNDTDTILTVAQIDSLNIEAFLPVALYGQVAVGAAAEVRPEDPIGGSYQARVVVIDRVLDAASGTFGIRLLLPNPDYRLPAGIRCTVRFRPE